MIIPIHDPCGRPNPPMHVGAQPPYNVHMAADIRSRSHRRYLTLTLALLLAAFAYPTGRAQEQTPAETPSEQTAPTQQTAPIEPADATYAPGTEALTAPTKVAVIPIEGMIYGFTKKSLRRRCQRAIEQGADHIVIEIDTYGGVALTAMEIARDIKQLPVATTCWINDKAISAGIVLASACDQIIMAPGSTTGDCAPIIPGQEVAPTERAKFLSPLLQTFEDNAEDNSYPFAILHATCELGIEVWDVQHLETGERKMVNQVDRQIMVKGVSVENAGKPGFWASLGIGRKNDGTAIRLGVYEADENNRGQWKDARPKPVHNGTTLLTIDAKQAVDYRLASSADIRRQSHLVEYLNNPELIVIEETWSEQLARFLTNPIVRGVLIMALLVGLYAEMNTPGLGIAGAVALGALVGLIAPPLVIELAQVWHLVVVVVGLILLGVEVFVLPGFGVAGVCGVICVLTGLVFAVVPTDGVGPIPLPNGEAWSMVGQSFLSVVAGGVVGVIAMVTLSRYFETLPLFNRFVLAASQTALTQAGAEESAQAGVGDVATVHLGEVGKVTADLRPAGRAQFQNAVVDVVSVSEWIEVGRPVRIVQIAGHRIVVDHA